jgi:hypothetical protein
MPETMSESDSATSRVALQAFPNTRWSVVLAARGKPSAASAEALETICRAYW